MGRWGGWPSCWALKLVTEINSFYNPTPQMSSPQNPLLCSADPQLWDPKRIAGPCLAHTPPATCAAPRHSTRGVALAIGEGIRPSFSSQLKCFVKTKVRGTQTCAKYRFYKRGLTAPYRSTRSLAALPMAPAAPARSASPGKPPATACAAVAGQTCAAVS